MTSTTTATKSNAMHTKKGLSPIQPTSNNYAYNIRNYVNLSRLIITVVTLLFTLGGAYYAFFLTPKYQATVYLSSKIYASLSASALSSDKVIPVDDKETAAPRQLQLLQTPQLLRRLIDQLQLDITIASNDPAVAKEALLIPTLSVPISLYDVEMHITPTDATNYLIQVPSLKFEGSGTVGTMEYFQAAPQKTIQLLVTEMPAAVAGGFTVTKQAKGEVIDHLLDNLVFDADGTDSKLVTNIITIAYTDMVPERSANVVNALAELAVTDSKEQEKEQAKYTVGLMAVERDYIQSYLDKTGATLATLSSDLSHVGFDEKIYGKQFADELTNLDKSIAESHAQLEMIAKTVTDQHPKFQEADAVLKSYSTKREKYDQLVKESVGSGVALLDLQRDLTVYTTLYQDVSKNLQQFYARLKEPVGDLRIIELACVPDTPSSLSRPVIIGLSLIVGLICGYIIALVFD